MSSSLLSVGQYALWSKLALKVPEPYERSFVGASERSWDNTRGYLETRHRRTGTVEDTVTSHLKFALKHERVDLGVLAATFRVMEPRMSPEKSAEGEAKLTLLFFAIEREVVAMREQTEVRQ